MVAIVWLISTITNILNPIGLILFCIWLVPELGFSAAILPLIVGVVGLVFGFVTFSYEVAPRMFWVKGKVGIFDMRMGAAFGYFISFFNSTVALMCLFEEIL